MYTQLEIEFTWSYLEEWEIKKIPLLWNVHPRTDYVAVDLVTVKIFTVGDWDHCLESVRRAKQFYERYWESYCESRYERQQFQIIRNPRAK